MGDSISTTDYGALVPGEIYWQLIQSWNNITDMAVSAQSGTTVHLTVGTAYEISHPGFVDGTRLAALGANGQPGFTLTFGATNDFKGVRAIASIGSPADTSLSSFYGALKCYFLSLWQAYPKAKHFYITPIYRADSGFPIYNSANSLYLYQIVDTIKMIAKDYGIIVIDAYQDSGITYLNMSTANNTPAVSYSTDSLHPINTGHLKMAKLINNQLLKHF